MKFYIIILFPLILALSVFGCDKDVELPEAQDEAFYFCLERLLADFGSDPAKWPDKREKDVVLAYLRDKHGVNIDKAVFGRNFLGLGLGESPEDAARQLKEGRKDAWGAPYDLVLASSGDEGGFWDILSGVAVNQGVALFNQELAKQTFVFLKADLHSRFADVFKNFNGVSAKLIVREINILGAPGSAAPDYLEQIEPALTAADAMRATVYIGRLDQVTLIMPEVFRGLAKKFGVDLPKTAAVRKPAGPMKPVPTKRIVLDGGSHDLEEYKIGMKTHGSSMLNLTKK